jgi:hypothetical protein
MKINASISSIEDLSLSLGYTELLPKILSGKSPAGWSLIKAKKQKIIKT